MLTTHDQTMSITLLSRCDLGAAHGAMRYRTTNLSQIRIRRTKPTRAHITAAEGRRDEASAYWDTPFADLEL